MYFNENLIKDSEKLPNKIRQSLEKGKALDNDWNDNELNCLINDCINIENNIKDIKAIFNTTIQSAKNQILSYLREKTFTKNNF